jgi:perosamine synthetase
MKEKLALFGGPKVISKPFKKYNSIGVEELNAAKEVLSSGVLSAYIGANGEGFLGGPKVREFEEKCKEFFDVKYAITTNSWTSGLIAAVGAIKTEPGDEIIVSPWTMAASATAILHWNAIPVFADIEKDTFCIDPISVEKNITPQTSAIMSIDIAGQSADMDALNNIAKKYNLKIISDTAQAPGALYKGKYAGTLADVGGYSLNYHKHIHTGEGGILVTNDEDIANRLRLIRNHGEATLGKNYVNDDLINIIGHNFRLGEIECAIGIEQLKKLEKLVLSRQSSAERLSNELKKLNGVQVPKIRHGSTHVYYMYPLIIDFKKIGVERDIIHKALSSEGVKGLFTKYQNIHLLPMYQNKIAYGSNGFPWSSSVCKRNVNYKKGICPIAESYNDNSHLGFQMCMNEMSFEDVDLMVDAFNKVWDNLDILSNS